MLIFAIGILKLSQTLISDIYMKFVLVVKLYKRKIIQWYFKSLWEKRKNLIKKNYSVSLKFKYINNKLTNKKKILKKLYILIEILILKNLIFRYLKNNFLDEIFVFIKFLVVNQFGKVLWLSSYFLIVILINRCH